VSLQQALERLAENDLPIVAGGTDFYPALLDRPAPLEVVDITQFKELRELDTEGELWRIGAGVTWTDVIKADLPPAFDALKAAACEVGSIQIQNRGTLVGNICNASPAADGVPALLALDALIELRSKNASRSVPLDQFITGVRSTSRLPSELITAILIPRPSTTEHSEFAKLGARRYLVISIAMLAVNIDCDDNGVITRCALSVGACSSVAQRLTSLENQLVGLSVLDTESIESAWTDLIDQDPLPVLTPIDDVRGSAAYRLSAVRTLLQRTVNSVALRCATALRKTQ